MHASLNGTPKAIVLSGPELIKAMRETNQRRATSIVAVCGDVGGRCTLCGQMFDEGNTCTGGHQLGHSYSARQHCHAAAC